MTDFRITHWGRYFIVDAQTPRGREWLLNHWRSQDDPPGSRATKVAKLLSEIVFWWANYPPVYTVDMSTEIAAELEAAGRIL